MNQHHKHLGGSLTACFTTRIQLKKYPTLTTHSPASTRLSITAYYSQITTRIRKTFRNFKHFLV